jgi:non-heme chloroperoxidase
VAIWPRSSDNSEVIPDSTKTPRPSHIKKVEVNGTELHYIEQGEGQPVIFVHGGLGDYRTWRPQIGPFSERYRAISYSRRGHYPNALPEDYTSSDMMLHVEDLAALIEALDLGRVHIVANSYGAYISLLLALHYPHLVRAMALAEPPVHPLLIRLPGGDALYEEFLRDAWRPAGEAFLRNDLQKGVRLFIEGAVGRGEADKLSPPVWDAMMKNALDMKVATHTPFEVHMPDFTCEDAAKIEAPTLLLYGERSPAKYRLINDELARCIPNAEKAVIPSAAHVLHNHNPEEHNRVVLDFLARH